ncbi:MAG: ubiquitin-like small modifier protein 1 [Bacillota bacterium]
MGIQVKLFSLFRKYISDRELELPAEETKTVQDMISILDERYEDVFSQKLIGDEGTVNPGAIILINGHNILHLDGLDTELNEGDKVAIFPPSAGG